MGKQYYISAAIKILSKHAFGFPEIKKGQEEIIRALALGRSVFAIFPTGYGKTLCYQIPVLLWNWKIFIVSPLISLLLDQRERMEKAGIPTLCFHSGLSKEERKEMNKKLWAGKWNIVLLSPERLYLWEQKKIWSSLQKRFTIQCIVLDEVHCFIEWKNFRPAYAKLSTLLENTGQTRVLGLSATLSNQSAKELCLQWKKNISIARLPIGKENIQIQVLPMKDEAQRWLTLCASLKNIQAPNITIVYCTTRRDCEEIACFLLAAGWSAIAYHAGVPPIERTRRQNAFMRGNISVICATTAFGLGVDYPWVERIIHWKAPPDLETYWQEVGRAGRAGQPAQAIVLWNWSNLMESRAFWQGAPKERKKKKEKGRLLWEYLFSTTCRKKYIAQYFGLSSSNCQKCDTCLHPLNPKDPWWRITGKQHMRDFFSEEKKDTVLL